MWHRVGIWEHHPSNWFQWLDRITRKKLSPLLNISTLKCVDNWLSKLPSETPDGKWLPYVNFYPKSWRTICTILFASDWKQAQTIIWPIVTTTTGKEAEQSILSDVHDSSTTVDIRTWIVTVLMSMFRDPGRVSWNMHGRKMKNFMLRMNCKHMKDFLQSLPALPVVESTAAMAKF